MKLILKSLVVLAMSLVSINSFAEAIPWNDGYGVELGALYIYQNSGDTTTALPMLNKNFWQLGSWTFSGQIGGTAYKDQTTNKTFWIGVLRSVSEYQFEGSKFAADIVIGAQSWENSGLKFDYGARINYDIADISSQYLNQAFVGVGSVKDSTQTSYVEIGVKRSF